ncbi:hypothetical protein KKF34_04980 [Myxococcota bacterium]|nr:hypothetical protein [Myxococcota bacterium]MBU1381187.1 hypothetical protein [Myxococcota bacterium]MBU1496214.1 hypothetical protein [Myxococcota bacterium]
MQFNDKRSMEHIRQQLVFLSVSLSIREHTMTLAAETLIIIEELDAIESKRFTFQEEATGALALLHASVTDLQLVVASLASHASMLDRLNPTLGLRTKLFPDGSSYIIRKSGTGIASVLDDLNRIVNILDVHRNLVGTQDLKGRLENSIDTVKARLDEYIMLNERVDIVLKDIDMFRKRTGDYFYEMEKSLKKIYGENKKIINSHFL